MGGVAGSLGGSGGSTVVGQSCAWLANCLSSDGCSSQACVEACAAQATSTAVDQYTTLIACVGANPQCTTTDCLGIVCADEIAACKDTTASVDAGNPAPLDAGALELDADAGPALADARPVPQGEAGGTAPADAHGSDATTVVDLRPSLDTDTAGPGPGQGYTTSGSCDIVVKIPGLADSHTCWDYALTVTSNHNDGTEHYVAYTSLDVSGTKSACTSQSYAASQPGPWDSASLSASNLSHKKQACDLAGGGYGATSTWTAGGSCSTAGSLGHCTDAVTNAWDPGTQVLSSSLVGSWSAP
jgi:hypothetical protein